jgi:hypothetical protein
VRVEITVVSVLITFVGVKITIHVEITLCVQKFHSIVYKSHKVSAIFTRISVKITLVYVETTLCVVKSHTACGYRTLRVEANLVRVVITFLRVVITSVRVAITLVSVIITHSRVKFTLCV